MKPMRGFTLIEMAIVLIVITLLIGGLAAPLSAQIQARRLAETRADLQAIKEALLGYALSHTVGKTCTCSYDGAGVQILPSGCPGNLCPAAHLPDNAFDLTYVRHYLPCPDTNNDGIEQARDMNGWCPRRGGLPWVTLGVRGHDAWGNRYTYAADINFTNNQNGFISTPTPTAGTLNIYPDAGCTTASVAASIPVVVVSHGSNSRGAQSSAGGTPLAAASVPVDERHNLPSATPVAPCTFSSFVSRTPNESFDDLLIWLSSHELFNRVCPSGGCP